MIYLVRTDCVNLLDFPRDVIWGLKKNKKQTSGVGFQRHLHGMDIHGETKSTGQKAKRKGWMSRHHSRRKFELVEKRGRESRSQSQRSSGTKRMFHIVSPSKTVCKTLKLKLKWVHSPVLSHSMRNDLHPPQKKAKTKDKHGKFKTTRGSQAGGILGGRRESVGEKGRDNLHPWQNGHSRFQDCVGNTRFRREGADGELHIPGRRDLGAPLLRRFGAG